MTAPLGNSVKITNYVEGSLAPTTAVAARPVALSQSFVLNGNVYTIFKQLFIIPSFPDTDTLEIPHGIENLYLNYQAPLFIRGMGYDNTDNWIQLPFPGTDSVSVSINATDLVITTDYDATLLKGMFEVEFCTTTDFTPLYKF